LKKLDSHFLGLGEFPALVVVDMCKAFIDPSSPLGFECSKLIDSNIKLVQQFRDRNLPIFFTTTIYRNESEASVFRKMSVEDNIKSVLEMTKLSKKEQNIKCEQLLDEFGLLKVRKNIGNLLSGGERRRTEIARALATEPKFILLDEPFAGVDPIAVEDIQKIVKQLVDKNIGVLITDHNVHETLSITDRAYLLFEGSVLRQGSSEELASDEKVRKLYLGKNFELRK